MVLLVRCGVDTLERVATCRMLFSLGSFSANVMTSFRLSSFIISDVVWPLQC